MPRASLQLPTLRFTRATAASASTTSNADDCRAAKTHVNDLSLSSDQQQQQYQEWAPSQIIRLQRIERQERESIARARVEAQLREHAAATPDDHEHDSHDGHGDNNDSDCSSCGSDGDEDYSELVQDFDVDEIFALSPATCPNMRGPAPPELVTPAPSPLSFDPQDALDSPRSISKPTYTTPRCSPRAAVARNNDAQLKLRIFTGTWNMAACDPFVDKRGQYIGDARAERDLAEFLSLGYDLYVVGTQEKVASKYFHAAMLARLNAASSSSTTAPRAASYVRLDLHTSSSSATPVLGTRDTSSNNNADSESTRPSVLRASSFGLVSSSGASSNDDGSGCDSPRPARSSDPATTLKASKRSSRRERDGHEVRGRGDGAFLHSKATSMAIYVAAHLAPVIDVVATGAHKFSRTSGSKGGLAVMVRVAGSAQTLTFVNCHLEANRPAIRRQQLATLMTELPRAMGLSKSAKRGSERTGTPPLDLAACSDHVVWMGDFNYRIHSLDGDAVLRLLASQRHMELHDRYDSMQRDMDAVDGMHRFREPRKWPTFYPTYKKRPIKASSTNTPAVTADPSWPLRVYRVQYREPFYKGGRKRARVPGWCDRILMTSRPAWHRYLEVEQALYTRSSIERRSSSSRRRETDEDSDELALRDNYRSVNDSLRGSDHSPVFCTFVWTVTSSC